MKKFEKEVANYAQLLTRFVYHNDLPVEWFTRPDHLAVKAADGEDYEAIIESMRPLSLRISEIELNKRRLATAELSGSMVVGVLGAVEWLEIMEPKPEKVGNDVVGLEHMEFCHPDFDSVIAVLNDRGVDFTKQDNPNHSWINIVLNERGQELKINDRPLRDIIAEELETGMAHVL